MASVFLWRLVRGVVSAICVGTCLLTACYGILLLASSVDRNRSSGGSTLLFFLSLVLIAFSLAIFIFWYAYWRAQGHEQAEKDNQPERVEP